MQSTKENAMIQGSSSDNITMRDIVNLIQRDEDPNQSIPFMAMNRSTRRAIMQEAKRRAKKR
jgi:hypothetical protein